IQRASQSATCYEEEQFTFRRSAAGHFTLMSRSRTSARHPVRSLITGITGQDGTYLARELLSRGRMVFGTTSRPPSPSDQHSGIPFRRVDYQDFDGLRALLHEIRPDEIYHLAGPSFIRDSGEFESEVAKLGVQRSFQS
ncbi:MAG: GDP-mannose 4,6-dehydratase, partial [Terrimicrobiaceae bacterium]